VILRILKQESPDSELRVKRYGSLKFQGPICDFGKWLGLYLEILLNSRVLFEILLDCGLISNKSRGLFVKMDFSWN
jgi:hypothetical protein